jgi:hypothetical protein
VIASHGVKSNAYLVWHRSTLAVPQARKPPPTGCP